MWKKERDALYYSSKNSGGKRSGVKIRTPTDGPNQKSHKCVLECFNHYDWLHYDVKDDKV